MKQIFLVEDDREIARNLSLLLRSEGFEVFHAPIRQAAVDMLGGNRFDLALVDISLPDGNGLEFCSRIRKESRVLFLFLTALDTEENIIAGYARGADDYITKPFSLNVLVSKVNALTKRFPKENPDSIVSGDITLYPEEKRVCKNGQTLSLTAREYSLLAFFMENPLHILSRNQLLESIWDIDGSFVDENTLSVNIRRLREKIEDDPSAPAILKNVRGLGYVWERSCEKR